MIHGSALITVGTIWMTLALTTAIGYWIGKKSKKWF